MTEVACIHNSPALSLEYGPLRCPLFLSADSCSRLQSHLKDTIALQDNDGSPDEDAEKEEHARQEAEQKRKERAQQDDRRNTQTQSRIVAYSDSESDDEHPGPFMTRRVGDDQSDKG